MIAPELLDVLDKLASEVRLAPVDMDLPKGRLWKGSYAYILLWEVGEGLREAAEEAKDMLDRIMQADGVDGDTKVVDGYAVLALAQAPKPKDSKDIHTVELNTSVCRIQVIWPEDGKWRGLSTLTLAAPPAFTAPVSAASWPALAADLQFMLMELQDLDGKELARRDVSEVEAGQ